MRKFLIIGTAGAVSAFLMFLVGLFFIPPIADLLQWPGARLIDMLAVSETAAWVAVVVFSWVSWAVVFGVMIAAIKRFLWPHKKLFWACSIAIVAILLFEARGTHNKEYEGTWELDDERSAFYSGGECWRPPYWLQPTSELSGASGKIELLGNPSAVRIKFIG